MSHWGKERQTRAWGWACFPRETTLLLRVLRVLNFCYWRTLFRNPPILSTEKLVGPCWVRLPKPRHNVFTHTDGNQMFVVQFALWRLMLSRCSTEEALDIQRAEENDLGMAFCPLWSFVLHTQSVWSGTQYRMKLGLLRACDSHCRTNSHLRTQAEIPWKTSLQFKWNRSIKTFCY